MMEVLSASLQPERETAMIERMKMNSARNMLDIVAVTVYRCTRTVDEVGRRAESRVREPLKHIEYSAG